MDGSKRLNETEKGLLKFFVVLALIGLVSFFLTGCAQMTPTLDKAIGTCFGVDGEPAYTRSESYEKFECKRPAVAAVRASR